MEVNDTHFEWEARDGDDSDSTEYSQRMTESQYSLYSFKSEEGSQKCDDQPSTGCMKKDEQEMPASHTLHCSPSAQKSDQDDRDSKISELEAKVSALQKELEHYKFHVGAYRTALQKFPEGLEKFQAGFREYRDNVCCPECEKDSLILKVRMLEKKIEDLEFDVALQPRSKWST